MNDESLNLFFKGFKRAFDFEGKTSREELVVFWSYLIAINVAIVLLSLAVPIFSIVYILWNLFIAVPGLSMLIRRLRDAGKSPYNLFFLLIPFIGLIYVAYLVFQPPVRKVDQDKQKNNDKFSDGSGRIIAAVIIFSLTIFALIFYYDPLRGECAKYSREYKRIVQEDVKSIILFKSRFDSKTKECWVQVRAYDSIGGRLEMVDLVKDIFNNKTVFINRSCGQRISCIEVEKERERIFYGK